MGDLTCQFVSPFESMPDLLCGMWADLAGLLPESAAPVPGPVLEGNRLCSAPHYCLSRIHKTDQHQGILVQPFLLISALKSFTYIILASKHCGGNQQGIATSSRILPLHYLELSRENCHHVLLTSMQVSVPCCMQS